MTLDEEIDFEAYPTLPVLGDCLKDPLKILEIMVDLDFLSLGHFKRPSVYSHA